MSSLLPMLNCIFLLGIGIPQEYNRLHDKGGEIVKVSIRYVIVLINGIHMGSIHNLRFVNDMTNKFIKRLNSPASNNIPFFVSTPVILVGQSLSTRSYFVYRNKYIDSNISDACRPLF